jgi:hypothetical protein
MCVACQRQHHMTYPHQGLQCPARRPNVDAPRRFHGVFGSTSLGALAAVAVFGIMLRWGAL